LSWVGGSGAIVAERVTLPDQLSPEVELLRRAYAAFNARDIDAALATMAPDVAWPRAFKGGFVRGHEEVRAYWMEQWSEIDPHVEPISFHTEGTGHILVDVHQVVRDRAGTVLADDHVGHRFIIESGLIRAMEVCSPPPSGQAT
jgi:ketosteroid isomerase-like protein